MDTDQLRKTVEWLDEERRKDKAEIAVLQERLSQLQAEATAQANRIQRLEADLAGSSAVVQRLGRLDEILDQMRNEVTRQIAALEQRRLEAERDAERVRQLEREGQNRAIGELRKSLEAVARLEQDMAARKEEEKRLAKVLQDVQKKLGDLTKHDDDRLRAVALLEETRRQDAKRIAELQAEAADLRKRLDEHKGRSDILEDMARRSEVKIGELAAAEQERKASQAAWIDQQTFAQAERDRWWNEYREKADRLLKEWAEISQRMEAFGETHRAMQQALEEYRHFIERMERRIAELAEIQRLAEDRFRQEWNAFLADDQKRWTTHMLLRDEQWREHDRQYEKALDRLAALEDAVSDYEDQIRAIREAEFAHLQAVANLLRDWLAEHDQTFVKVR